MAEPGRFFAELAFTLVVNVIGKWVWGEAREYWINDGIHGSLMGETALECANGNLSHRLPELEVGDWLVFGQMGKCGSESGTNVQRQWGTL
ncbi:hypothetical protein TIFTF001_024691 [Ficus carica]|uniref:Uncharacterized protein n=1 Tax=Ficus carica TaxID=3494 RepID=A0AA88AQ79_FICCA|nr:hypothetical protein TIFTF001_024691 [Ficus carica]